ncbi:hypothetical protein STEG23_027011 [Scotinomys teguina]
MTVMPLGRDQDCSLKNREPDGPAPWFLDPRGWSKTAAVRLFFIFPGICTLSLEVPPRVPLNNWTCGSGQVAPKRGARGTVTYQTVRIMGSQTFQGRDAWTGALQEVLRTRVPRKLKTNDCSGWFFQLSLEVLPPLMFPMTVTPLGWDQDCSLKIREPEVPAPWFLDPGGWSKTATVSLYFIFPGICTLSLEFKTFFACMMNDIILEIYDLPKSYLACTLLAFTLIIHTAFKYWLTNKNKDESLLGLIQTLKDSNEGLHKKILSLESANHDLQNRLLNLESANLMQELQSINSKFIAKIGFVDNKYEYLMDRTLTLQSDIVTTKTQCKEERLSLIDKIRSLESCVSEEHNRWYDSMKNLESQAREEVHSLEQTLCARLQALEETLCKHDKEPNKQKGKTIKVVTSPNGSNPMVYPVIIHERPADDTHPEPYVTHSLQPISIRDFKNMKEAIVTYGIHSTYVK